MNVETRNSTQLKQNSLVAQIYISLVCRFLYMRQIATNGRFSGAITKIRMEEKREIPDSVINAKETSKNDFKNNLTALTMWCTE